MLKIALTGADGLVGSRIIELLKNDFQFIPLSQKLMNIADKDNVQRVLKPLNFDLFFHLAAYTNVDGAEENRETTYKINVDGTKHVFDAVTKKNKKFIYVSTDFVFDGKNSPYDEDNLPNPISYYALTKYEGERLVKDKAMIVRLSYPYRAKFDLKRDFVRNIKYSLDQKKTLMMVTDSLFTPTFIDDIAHAMKYLFDHYAPDIFHLVGENSLSPYDAGRLIAKTFKLNQSLIQPITYSEYFKERAKRPQFSEIKSKKNNFYPMKSFEVGLQIMYHQSL